MYHITFRGNKREVSAGVFWALAVPLIALFAGMLFIVYATCAGIIQLAGWLGLLAFIILFGTVTVTGKGGNVRKYAIIKNDTLRGFLSFPIVAWALFTYFFR